MINIYRTAEEKQFGFHVITSGDFIDAAAEKKFVVSSYVLRLNRIAFDEYLGTVVLNAPECYKNREDWISYKVEKDRVLKDFENKIIRNLGLENTNGGIKITQSQSEVFTVVHIFEL